MRSGGGQVVLFDEARRRAVDFVIRHTPSLGTRRVLVRDLFGRIRVVVEAEKKPSGWKSRAQELHRALGAYSPGADAVLVMASDLAFPEVALESPDAHPVEGARETHFLDRQLVGQDWLRSSVPLAADAPARATLFGLKGGVGRSTALACWAWQLARSGQTVLVVDLDLESPGVSATLLGDLHRPDFGLVDWFVEGAVGQSDAVVAEMVSRSPLSAETDGEILVCPTAGRRTEEYLPKLARAYVPVASAGPVADFAARLAGVIAELEEIHKPSVVLLDSRAGLHDIAAVAVTRLDALSLLFAVNTSQTWQAYRYLLEHWRSVPQRTAGFRHNLRLVAALVPETGADDYLQAFRDSAYGLFLDTLYEEAGPGELDVFSFGRDDTDAPHFPFRINWSRALQEFDPVARPHAVTEEQIRAATGSFVRKATLLLGSDLE